MKLAIFLLTAALFQARGNLLAQKVTISGKSITLKQVFDAIEKQTDFVVFSNESFLKNTKPVSITVHDVSVSELLELVLKDQPVQFSIKYNTIFLSPRAESKPGPVPALLQSTAPPLIIQGALRSAEGEILSGASVRVKQSGHGAITDSKGSFQLKTDEESPVLQITMVGYEMVEAVLKKTASGYDVAKVTGGIFTINNNAPGNIQINIAMKKAASMLDETQITAYGKTNRRMATGNIGTVTAEEIERQPVMTALEAIIGRVPGVEVKQVSGNSAAPMSITIRGGKSINSSANNDPLYVIDGIPMNNLNANFLLEGSGFSIGSVQGGMVNTLRGENMLLGINPGDIESISILKDADATAIYGSRGSNGVILITTKKAKQGPTRFALSVNNGTKSIQRYPTLLHTAEYLAIRREAFRNDGITPTRDNAPDLTIWDQNKYTDWQKTMVGTGSMTTINADVSGGMRQTTYRLSASYTTQKEIMNNGGKNLRGTFMSAINHTSTDQKFNFTLSNSLALTEVKAYNLKDFGNMAPNAPDIYNSKGEFNFEPYRIQGRSDFAFNGLKSPSESQTYFSNNTMYLSYEILRGLSISTRAGYQFSNNSNANYTPPSSIDQTIQPQPFSSMAYYGSSSIKNLQVEPQLKYRTNVGRGVLDVQLIATWQSAQTRSTTIIAQNFPNDAMLKSYNNAATVDPTDNYIAYKYLSAAAIIRYEWDRKYIVNLNGRRDGSSRFGPGKQFGNFGSVGLAWIVSEENWLKTLLPSWISLLKLRGSYGITGSDRMRDYEYLSRWSKNASLISSRSVYPYDGITSFHVLTPLNQQFQWESNRKSEIGASVSFLKDKMNLEVVYYSELSGNQLTTLPIPRMSGFEKTAKNWPAEIRNSGIEISANARLLQSNNWGLDVGFNIGRNRNKVIHFPDFENSSYYGQLKVGYSTSTVFALRYTGIDPLTGSYTFEDYNKDGVIYKDANAFPTSNTDDRYLAIETMPKFTGGFSLNLSYKTLRLHSSFAFKNGLRVDPYINTVPGDMTNFVLTNEIRNNHWKNPGDAARYPRYTTSKSTLGPIEYSDANYTNGSYVRLTNLSIAWSIPSEWISKIRIKNATFSIQAQNLFVLSPYKGLDPEISTFYMTTPVPRTITTNLSFNF
ncbi:SusC/RagA family TonB-linked outer membrane protein [Pseudobacter ginsenosidimutans]|nr:SusC/RagA family TonB-linked outer membrane protein [Pseudobacter ginsenosidimutans]